ncbi:MAG: SRPBCC domain-containing protein [Patescibacteria group bacterium]
MQINETYTIEAPVEKVWQALTDATVIEHWTTGPAHMDTRPGGMFSLYDGDIHGTNTNVVPHKLLQQDWHGDDNPERKYDVTFTLESVGDTTRVRVTHAASDDDAQSMRDGWEQHYFKPMKQLLERQASTKITLKLIGKEHVAGNAWSFRFEPSQPLHWLAGQYIWVELRHDNPDAEGARRWFTVSSAPYEGFVQITTRVSNSTFKQALNALPEGGELRLLEKPDGDFVWQDSRLPLVFIAGGIGITAFHSILKQRVHEELPLSVTLIYGNRDEDIPFKDELEQWAANNPHFKIHYLTGMPLTAESLAELESNLNGSLVYISGPEPMVEALGDQLIEHGLPQAQLRLDALVNYNKTNY